MYCKVDNKRLTTYEWAIVKQRIRCFSKYVSDVVVFHLRMARRGRNMLWTKDKNNTNKFSVEIAGIFERYMYT
jgi:hypothetical protein